MAAVVRAGGRIRAAARLSSRSSSAAAFATAVARREPWERDLADIKSQYDAVIVGGGHNGLVAACYLAKQGKKVCVLERRHVIGGAAVTEEIVPGFKFSRASYLLSLFRQSIIDELELKKFGFKVYLRDPSSFTPLRDASNYLLLGSDGASNHREISKFSRRDADAYGAYEDKLARLASIIDPVIDSHPPVLDGTVSSLVNAISALAKPGMALARDSSLVPELVRIMTAPATQILNAHFESEVLKATLATDAVIGAFVGPDTPGSGYVLFHHVMGNLEGRRGAWGYVEGGMGAVSLALARCAASHGVDIFLNAPVDRIAVADGVAQGVTLADGKAIAATTAVLSNATPHVTFDLLDADGARAMAPLMPAIRAIDYSSATMKINVAINALPNFTALPNGRDGAPMPHHQCTIHFEESVGEIQRAYVDALGGVPSRRPVIEFCMPSVRDPTLAPRGHHVVNLFVQYAPYKLATGSWDDIKEQFADKVFSIIEEYAPGFTASVVGRDILSPLDLERTFGLTGGNIFHGSMGLNQLYLSRPLNALTAHATPVDKLYLCGSGSHPGGGVMGAAGRNAARIVAKKK